jgi:hypothetical protein
LAIAAPEGLAVLGGFLSIIGMSPTVRWATPMSSNLAHSQSGISDVPEIYASNINIMSI